MLIVAVAGRGVLNLVVLDARQRVHDLGILKALDMSSGQTITMVLTSVVGIIGVPLCILTHEYVMPLMGTAIGTAIPSADINVYSLPEVAALALGGSCSPSPARCFPQAGQPVPVQSPRSGPNNGEPQLAGDGRLRDSVVMWLRLLHNRAGAATAIALLTPAGERRQIVQRA